MSLEQRLPVVPRPALTKRNPNTPSCEVPNPDPWAPRAPTRPPSSPRPSQESGRRSPRAAPRAPTRPAGDLHEPPGRSPRAPRASGPAVCGDGLRGCLSAPSGLHEHPRRSPRASDTCPGLAACRNGLRRPVSPPSGFPALGGLPCPGPWPAGVGAGWVGWGGSSNRDRPRSRSVAYRVNPTGDPRHLFTRAPTRSRTAFSFHSAGQPPPFRFDRQVSSPR